MLLMQDKWKIQNSKQAEENKTAARKTVLAKSKDFSRKRLSRTIINKQKWGVGGKIRLPNQFFFLNRFRLLSLRIENGKKRSPDSVSNISKQGSIAKEPEETESLIIESIIDNAVSDVSTRVSENVIEDPSKKKAFEKRESQYLPDILPEIFKYLTDTELLDCRQVCTTWKAIVEDIMYQKVTIAIRTIPVSLIESTLFHPQNMQRYLQLTDRFQCVWFVLENYPVPRCSRCPYCLKEPIESRIVWDLSRQSIILLEGDEIEIQFVIFPKVPGFDVFHFPYRKTELCLPSQNLNHYTKKFAEMTTFEWHCVICYREFGSHFFDESDRFNDIYTIRREAYYIVGFHGERVNSFSVYIEKKTCDYKTLMKRFERLKCLKPTIVQKRCFVYINHRACFTVMSVISLALKNSFPLVSCIEHKYYPFHYTITPSENYHFDCKTKEWWDKDFLAEIVFLWWS
ncbi:uncharacterized protein [Centruroides vittatus]|uniref:uncharacterized protein n=1 Tax=Centruroides vittatus TaxID=120091 RepID=UPI00350FF7E8